MKRRKFIGTAVTGGFAGACPSYGAEVVKQTAFRANSFPTIPETIAGMSREELRNDYRDRMFDRYLPFWDRGGYDREHGGVMCELYDDGSVQSDEKYIWYQGRALWVYSFLYNRFGRDERHLEIAKKTRDFMVRHMYLGDGRWQESAHRDGSPMKSTGQGTGNDIYGAMFAASGLFEFFRAAGKEENLALAKTSVWSSMKAYNDPGYRGVSVGGFDETGLRAQGHSFMVVWPLTQLLSWHEDPKLEELQREHISHIMNDFWNSDYGIVNENLRHDYSRIPGLEAQTFTGHSMETLWMILHEAVRIGNRELFTVASSRFRRLLEMGWDYIFDGHSTGGYNVFASPGQCAGAAYDTKTMWAHTEILIACMTILEYTGEVWAREWYERARAYCLRVFANTDNGIWRQAVDRFGKDKKRAGISIYRRGNFHQPRYFMMNMLSLDRMIENGGRLTPFAS